MSISAGVAVAINTLVKIAKCLTGSQPGIQTATKRRLIGYNLKWAYFTSVCDQPHHIFNGQQDWTLLKKDLFHLKQSHHPELQVKPRVKEKVRF